MFAFLFAFYDGRDGAPSITSRQQAQRFAHNNGFAHEDHH